jgi:subtilase family serine protease
VGINKVTFTIEPDKKAVESSEDNNSLSVTFDVSRLGIPGKKTLRKN